MKIGFTTSFPIEPVIAAGHIPVDLNNIFITGDAGKYVSEAEIKGFPRSLCAWIKGMYATILSSGVDKVIGIVQGDCSNTHALMSILTEHGIPVIPFSFPYGKEPKELDKEIRHLEDLFDVTREQTLKVKQRLDKIRKKLVLLDKLSWEEQKVSGLENHLWLVNASDFTGNPDQYESSLDEFLLQVKERNPFRQKIRLGYVGVPPIISDLYPFLEENNTIVVFNEVQRQFAMPHIHPDIVEQYRLFTYPYTIQDRLKDILHEVEKRRLDGIISYTQSFCHRQLDHLLIKKHLPCPVLQLEADQPGPLDARTKIRLESFLEMLG